MKISLACDHGALALKRAVRKHLEELGHEVVDFGTDTLDSCDYADFGIPAAKAVASGECERGIVLCTTGIGMSMTANKVKGIRCCTCSESYSARLSRQHNNSNIVSFGARVIGVETAKDIVDAWIGAEYEGGRHQMRIDMIAEIGETQDLAAAHE